MSDCAGSGPSPTWLRSVTPDIPALAAWLDSFPGADLRTAKLRVCHSSIPGADNGVVAKREILPGELLARVPVDAVLHSDIPSKEEPFSGELADACAIAGRQRPAAVVQLWLYLIHARHRPEARHHAYVRNFPVSLNSPFFWSDEELEGLSGTPLWGTIRRQRLAMWKEYGDSVRPLTEADPAHFPPDIFNFRALVWARSTCGSRAFPASLAGLEGRLSSDFIMIPMLDLFNHRGDASIEWRGVEQCGGEGIEFRVPQSAPRPIAAGQEIWNDYGANSNEDLLMAYGFIPERNKHNKVSLIVLAIGSRDLIARCREELRRRSIPSELAKSMESQLRVGPFALSRAGGGAAQNGRLSLPAGLIASFNILASCGSSGSPVQFKHTLVDLFKGIMHSWPEPAEEGESFRSTDADDGSATAERRRLCNEYIKGQWALMKAALDAVENLSENDLHTHAAHFNANSAFLDRLEGISRGQKLSDNGGSGGYPSNVVEGLDIRLCLAGQADDEDVGSAIQEKEQLGQLMEELFQVTPPWSEDSSDMKRPKAEQSMGLASVTTSSSPSSTGKAATAAPEPIELWVEFDGARVKVKNAQDKQLIEVMKMAYVYFSRKVGEARLPMNGLVNFHLELIGGATDGADITDLARKVGDCGLVTGATLSLRARSS